METRQATKLFEKICYFFKFRRSNHSGVYGDNSVLGRYTARSEADTRITARKSSCERNMRGKYVQSYHTKFCLTKVLKLTTLLLSSLTFKLYEIKWQKFFHAIARHSIGYTNIIKISQNATVATVRRNLCILFVTYKLNLSIIFHLIFLIKFSNNTIFPLSLKRYCMYFNFQNKNFFVVGYRLRHHASPKHRVEATL